MVDATYDVTALVGHHYRVDDYYEVGREKVREYARAVQDDHPAHWTEKAAAELGYSGLVAPTTFVSIPAMIANRRLFESVITGYNGYLQTDQVFELYKPLVAGDRLFSDVELETVRQVAGKDLLTVKNTFTDQAGEVVHVMHTTVVGLTSEDVAEEVGDAMARVVMHGVELLSSATNQEIAASNGKAKDSAPEAATALSDFSRTRQPQTTVRFEDLAVGFELPAREARLTRGDLVNYAGVSGDPNPIHWHDGIAVLSGLPDVIAHGMLTMGLGAGFITDWLGDPGALTRYSVRLSNYAIVEAKSAGNLEFSGRIKSLDPETRTAVLVITAKSAGRKIFGLATADIRLA
ncbi:fused (3R)-hydroxyacyl-ACP dehydratase subunits HadA/HadB [Nocardia sp. NPDC020380]|uniref:fused (3R)-hydroxyacyl-ACP dehydratase subunits HadA/HadB n=1 Tax=Nocardia sp. NPDC020380 TaxID=3364309 RepID=UPI0037AC6180